MPLRQAAFSQDYRANSIIEMYQREGTYEKINDIVKVHYLRRTRPDSSLV